MDSKQTNTGEVTIIDVFFVIKKKIKIIAFITLIATILGAATGIAFAFLSNTNYGATAEFRLKTNGNNSYVLTLLKSDRFAEKLLLDNLNKDKNYGKNTNSK